MADRYPLIGIEQGVILVAGRLFGPGGRMKNVILLLDTGASMTAIRAAVLAQVEIDLSQPRERRRVETMGGPVIEGIVEVPRLRVFGQERERLEVVFTARPFPYRVSLPDTFCNGAQKPGFWPKNVAFSYHRESQKQQIVHSGR